jgi:hypothetical protein
VRVTNGVSDLGAERTLALASAVADDFARTGWKLADYRWSKFEPGGTSRIELDFDSTGLESVVPEERRGSGLALQNPMLVAWVVAIGLPLAIVALVALTAFLGFGRHV